MVQETGIGSGGREFPATRWTLLLAAGAAADDASRRLALEDLAERYWRPLYFHARRKGLPIEGAKDAVQAFFAHLAGGDFLARLDPARGRLRSYLRGALDNFLINLHEKEAAAKRGGGRKILPLEVEAAERDGAAWRDRPDAAFDREWALGLLERAAAALRAEFEEGRRKGDLEVVLSFVGFGEPPPHAEAAARCGMSGVQFKAFLHRCRKRYRELVRLEIGRTVERDEEVDAELAELLRVLGASRPDVGP